MNKFIFFILHSCTLILANEAYLWPTNASTTVTALFGEERPHRYHAGIDVRKVVDTGIVPIINTGIAHKDSGVGQIGAGISHVPQQVFLKALNRIGDLIPNAD